MKKAYKDAENKLRTSFALIEKVKQELNEEIKRINADTWTSDSRKEQLENQAVAAARVRLMGVREAVDMAAGELDVATQNLLNAFDYGDTKLTAALNFVRMVGRDAPDEAVRQIVNDFKHSPAALKLVKKQFDKSGMGEASMDAETELRRFESVSNVAQRVSDLAYYSTTGNLAEKMDTASLLQDIADIGAALGIEEGVTAE